MKTIIKLLIFIVLCMVSLRSNAQDIITKKDGTDIQAKVQEITASEVKYKKFDNQSGSTFSILKTKVLMIRYENGTKDVFEQINTNSENKSKENNGIDYSNSIFVELIGAGSVISINYERILISFDKMQIIARFGCAYGISEKLAIPLSYQMSFGSKSHHFEIGNGLTYDFGYSEVYLNYIIGYKYQKAKGGFFFRANINLLTFTTLHENLKLNLIPGLTFGYSF